MITLPLVSQKNEQSVNNVIMAHQGFGHMVAIKKPDFLAQLAANGILQGFAITICDTPFEQVFYISKQTISKQENFRKGCGIQK